MSGTPAWHFTCDMLRDGRPLPAVGVWLVHEGPIKICCTGLHASERLIDALSFAPGHQLHRVTLRGIEGSESNKLVARERRIDWSLNAEPVLRAFARRCALDILPLWPDAPAVVRQYLETGDETIRDAASVAASNAAKDWAAERYAAKEDAPWNVAWDVAWATAAEDAPWWAVAWSAAWGAARGAAWNAAGAKLDLYNGWLTEMVMLARKETKE